MKNPMRVPNWKFKKPPKKVFKGLLHLRPWPGHRNIFVCHTERDVSADELLYASRVRANPIRPTGPQKNLPKAPLSKSVGKDLLKAKREGIHPTPL